jgi:hypothetical protein
MPNVVLLSMYRRHEKIGSPRETYANTDDHRRRCGPRTRYCNGESRRYPEGITPLGHGTPSIANDPVLEKLERLAGTQTEAEISEILKSGAEVEALYDTNVGKYIAAFAKPLTLQKAISVVGPGCSTASACAWANGTTPYGYAGTGSMSINLKNVNKIRAGDKLTTFWTGGTGAFVQRGTTATLSPAWNLTKVTRS